MIANCHRGLGMAASDSTDETDSAPLDSRELDHLRSQVSAMPPRLSLMGGLIAVAVGLGMVIASPELHDYWSLFGFGVLFLIGLLMTLSIYHDQQALRTDLAGGVKLWRDGYVHALWTSEDSDTGRTHYSVEIAIDPRPDSDPDPQSPMSFRVPSACYGAVARGDRVRIAFTPRQAVLLNLINGNYEYIILDGHGKIISSSPDATAGKTRPG
jgi:hypothetical protein